MMREQLLQFLQYNDWANKELLTGILQLSDKEEAVALFSHMIQAQDVWYSRVVPGIAPPNTAPFAAAKLLDEWERSTSRWREYLANSSDEELEKEIVFITFTGLKKAAKIKDTAFQINCHSVHHRAQIAKMISRQGVKVPVTDYILTAWRDVE